MAQASNPRAYADALDQSPGPGAFSEGAARKDELQFPADQFPADEAELCACAAEFVRAGLAEGCPVILVVTAERLKRLAEYLSSSGVELAAACASGRVRTIEARAALDAVMASDRPDAARGQRQLLQWISGAPEGRVFVYSEMLELLWRAGKRSAAVLLEELWIELSHAEWGAHSLAYSIGGIFRQAQGGSRSGVAVRDSAEWGGRMARQLQMENALRQALRELRSGGHPEAASPCAAPGPHWGAPRQRLGAAERTARLVQITAAMAEAVDTHQVLTAVVDRVAAALDASSAGLWLLSESGESMRLARSVGYADTARARIESVPLHVSPSIPAVDAVLRREPLWLESQAELLRHYPHLSSVVTPGRGYSIACLPLVFQDEPRGCVGFTFDDERVGDEEERDFLLLIARYSAQAIERMRLLEVERLSRARAELLYELAAAVNRAKTLDDVFEAALAGIEQALGTERCSILAFDGDGVMRFKAWRGLSVEYRRAVEGHSPWARDAAHAEPIVVADAQADPALAAYAALFRAENIGALGFIPLISEGRLVGKFMVYYPVPRVLSTAELDMAQAIANHIAAGIGRFSALAELQQTVHFNEMFTGMLGHDLRNPLGAIMAAAHIALRRSESNQLTKPLSRIVGSGARMARMIDQLLDFTRVRVGAGIPVEVSEIDVVPIVSQAMDELRDAHPDWEFRLELGEGETRGFWDSDRILQVFSNVVANAAQHGRLAEGVSVQVDGSSEDTVCVRIHNQGTIPRDILPRLFEPMAGGDRRRRNSRGLGLGLFISREIVRAHGGRIDVETSEVAGTTFTVWLPRGGGALRRGDAP